MVFAGTVFLVEFARGGGLLSGVCFVVGRVQ